MKSRFLIFTLFASNVFSQSWNTTLIGQLDYPQFVNDVWGYKAENGKEYALVGTSLGTSIVDVTTNPFQPVQVGFIPGEESTWRDIKFYNNHMYISTEAEMGIQVADITDPESPELVYEWEGISRAHNLFQADGYLYVVGADEGEDMEILDLSNPAEPARVGGWLGEYLHDVYVRDNYAYGCGIYSSTMYIIDVSDKSNPFTVTSWSYPGSAHAAWLTEDGDYLISGDETSGGNIKIWDISDFDNINMVSEWTPEGGEEKSAHNVFIRGDYLYISYYVFGLQILNISDPANPELAGYYDTYPGEDGLYEGNWGVYPYAESCHSYVSDMEAGLVLVDFDGCVNPDPDLSFSPSNFSVSASQGETVSEVITINNTGDDGSTLFFRVETMGSSSFENPGGEPDSFGYEWSDSDLETEINYNWIDIEGHINTDEIYFPTNDEAGPPINLPFAFPFYGINYSFFIVNPNGWVGFGSDNNEWNNFAIPSPDAPGPAIFALWDDLNPVNEECNEYCSGDVYVNSNETRTVIWFNDIAQWFSGDLEAFFDFQIVLYSNGKINVNYRSISGAPSATIGMQNQDGTDGLLVSYLEDYIHDFLTLEFNMGEIPSWISFNDGENEGQLIPGESEDVYFQINTGQLDPGVYSAELKILNNALPSVVVPVNLDVLAPSEDVTIVIPHLSDWNLVGLPLISDNSHYHNIFPTSIPGSCYEFNEEYIQADILEMGRGYWLRFGESGSDYVTGTGVDELVVGISEGWNLITGTTDLVDLNNGLFDPAGLLVPGTFYGFNGNYQNISVLEPGEGYWVRAFDEGEIILSSTTPLSNKPIIDLNSIQYNTLAFGNQTLFFGADELKEDLLSYSLPPKPPTGGKDIRFMGDTKLCGSSKCYIEVMNPSSALKLTYDIQSFNDYNSSIESQYWVLVNENTKEEIDLIGKGKIEIEGDISELTLKKSKSTQISKEFIISPAYPNPFNPVTVIQISIPELTYMKINIYDVRGRLVEKLIDDNLDSGLHNIKWNASDVSSGMYFLQLDTDSYNKVEKLMLIK